MKLRFAGRRTTGRGKKMLGVESKTGVGLRAPELLALETPPGSASRGEPGPELSQPRVNLSRGTASALATHRQERVPERQRQTET